MPRHFQVGYRDRPPKSTYRLSHQNILRFVLSPSPIDILFIIYQAPPSPTVFCLVEALSTNVPKAKETIYYSFTIGILYFLER